MLVFALGMAAGSAKVFGVSMALGAFLAGMVVDRSEFSLPAAFRGVADARRLCGVCSSCRSASLFDLGQHIWNRQACLAATLAIILIGKPLSCAGDCAALLGYPTQVARGRCRGARSNR